ncbi:MAG: AAA family ATPase [Clostridia bacterium]|nr:AAA family ATPase [Clostridia bacterium]
MNKLVMMVGLPGSGKSTIAKEIAKKFDAVLHASDDLRTELFGNPHDQVNNEILFQEMNNRINRDLSDGKSVVYDATNLSYKKRKACLQSLKTKCYKECFLVATPYEKCLSRNKLRKRVVPEPVIEKMYKYFFVPQYYEGWDHIEIIYTGDDRYDLDELFNDLDTISQDNPHHTLTIGRHCKKCLEYIREIQDDDTLMMAALLHDIGKKFTKGFSDLKGNPTKEAHYYSHQNVSAYLSLFYLKHLNIENILEITNYIQWHMQPFNLHSGKSKKKFLNLMGQEFYDNLLKLHEADTKAK